MFFFLSGDTIKIRVSENSSPLSLTHVDDFGKYFPDVDLSPPERSDQLNSIAVVLVTLLLTLSYVS